MSLYNDILANLKHKIDAHNAFRDDVVSVVKEVTNVSINPEHIVSLKEGILTLRVPPTIKMAINLKTDAIRSKLRDKNIQVTIIR